MTHRPGQQSPQSPLTRARMLALAQALFARKGYAGVSMREIAAALGVRPGTLYRRAADKQTLLFDLMQAHLQALEAVRAAAAPGPAAIDRLATFVQGHLDVQLDRPEAARLVALERQNLAPENRARVETALRDHLRALEAILEAGVASGQLRVPDTRLGALAVIALLDGLVAAPDEAERLGRARMARIGWNMVRRLVRG